MVFRADGYLDYSQDPNGIRTTANYSGTHLTGYTDSNGDTTTFGYNGAGRLTSVTDAVGRQTTFTYDLSGAQLQSITSGGRTTQFEYSTATDVFRRHAITRVILPDGNSQNFEYDSLGRYNRRSLNGVSEAVTYTYGPQGQIIATDAQGHTTSLQATARSGGIAVGPLGDVATVVRDAMGNLTRYSVGGAVFSLSYDQQKNLAEATDGLGCTVQYSYEPDHNRLTRFSDPNGNVTTMQYDDRGNLSAVQRADGTSETFGYDARGWPIEHTVAVRAKWR